MSKTWKPIAAGVLNIVGGAAGIVFGVLAFLSARHAGRLAVRQTVVSHLAFLDLLAPALLVGGLVLGCQHAFAHLAFEPFAVDERLHVRVAGGDPIPDRLRRRLFGQPGHRPHGCARVQRQRLRRSGSWNPALYDPVLYRQSALRVSATL